MKTTFLILMFGSLAFGQVADKVQEKENEKALRSSKNLTWEANKELSQNNFANAEANYRKAIAKSDENAVAPYNLGNAYYEKETYNEAFSRFKQAGEMAVDKNEKHSAYHNMGNVFMKNKEYEKAVDAYKQALRNNPNDEETRYNLALAKEMLKKQQDEDKKNDKNQDKKDEKDKNQDDKKDGENNKDNKGDQKDDKNKDKGDEGDKGDQKKEENKNGEGDKKEEEKKPEEGKDPSGQNEQQQPRPNQLSPQQVKNLLEAMQNEEKKVKEKIDAQKAKGVKVKNEKDW
ncbi:tetratricopeptide repeat protein [Flavobacteriaceae bacterium KMM 6897]|nr:tetratricopeptide repeat protein [Flavobacteriaceae bacterium KMM 6897]MEB8346096.1 tetratricopeptide repeat protein [Flavobacteriaceae bacterium KMM 6898]